MVVSYLLRILQWRRCKRSTRFAIARSVSQNVDTRTLMRSLLFPRQRAHRNRPALTLPAALFLACALSACGGGSSTPGTAVPDTTPKPEMRCAP